MHEDRPALDPANAYSELRLLLTGKPTGDPAWRRFWVIGIVAWAPAFSICFFGDVEPWSLTGLVILAASLAAGFLVEAALRRFVSATGS